MRWWSAAFLSFRGLQAASHALFNLAADPDLAAVLREEVEAVLKEEGWTKNAFVKMRKLDSFLRETQRCNGDDSRTCVATSFIELIASSDSTSTLR